MNFDPYDPMDPLGNEQPFEMQNSGPILPPTKEELAAASRLTLEKAREQALGESRSVWEAIDAEIQIREEDERPPKYEGPEPIAWEEYESLSDGSIDIEQYPSSCDNCDNYTLMEDLCIGCSEQMDISTVLNHITTESGSESNSADAEQSKSDLSFSIPAVECDACGGHIQREYGEYFDYCEDCERIHGEG